MLIIREKFIAKPGNASKLAKMMKEMRDKEPGADMTIMTDVTGQFNTVVVETRVADLTVYEKRMQEYMNPTPEMKVMMDKMKGYTEMYSWGSRQIFRIVE